MSLSPLQFGHLMPKLLKRPGEDFSDVVNAFAHGTPGNENGDSSFANTLPLSRGRVLVSDLPNYEPNQTTFEDYDDRTKSAARGYKNNPASVPLLFTFNPIKLLLMSKVPSTTILPHTSKRPPK